MNARYCQEEYELEQYVQQSRALEEMAVGHNRKKKVIVLDSLEKVNN